MTGLHWRAQLRKYPRFVNIPYGPHKVLVLGLGRMDSRGGYHPHQPCVFPMHLQHCCPPERRTDGTG